MATKRTDPTQGSPQASTGAAGGSAQKGASAAKKGAAATKGATGQGQAAVKATDAVSSQKSAGGGRKSASAQKGGGAGLKSAQKGTGSTGAARKTRSADSGPDLRADARNFVSSRPQGWNHDEWLGFLEDLRQRGHNVEDKDAVGAALERERLGLALEKVPGIGATRVRAIADRYPNIWRLKETSPDDLAREANLPRPLAERILESLQ